MTEERDEALGCAGEVEAYAEEIGRAGGVDSGNMAEGEDREAAARALLLELLGKRDGREGELREMRKVFRRNISPGFLEAHRAMKSGKCARAILAGGRGSLKSSFVSLHIALGLEEDERGCALVLRKVSNTLRGSVFEQMQWALDVLGVGGGWEATVTPMEFVNRRTGQKIMLRGLDEPRKLKSIKLGRGMYFKYVWFEEMDEFGGEREMDSVLESALRGGPGGMAIATFNPPRSLNHWANRLATGAPEGWLVHRSDYRSAPKKWLGPAFLRMAEAMRLRDERQYRWVYLGECVGEGGCVFGNVRLRGIGADERMRFDLKADVGMDFGYVDPVAIVRTHYEAGELRRLYIYEEFYRSGMSTREIAAACRKIAREGELIRADNAGKQTIIDLRTDYGIEVAGVVKGPGSRRDGYDWLRGLDEIVIDPASCPNAAREFTAYAYAKDAGGQSIERYPDGDDHTIDAAAYGNREHIYRSTRVRNVSGKRGR